MSDQKPPSALIPSPPRSLDLPGSTRLALPVAGAAVLVWAGKKAMALFRRSGRQIPVGKMIEGMADDAGDSQNSAPTTRVVYIHQTNIWISIQHKHRNP